MAVIGSIRKRVGLLIGIVGVSMVLFILGDLVTSNSSFLQSNPDIVGVIGGEKIRYQEFEARVDKLTENYKMNQRVETIDAATQDGIRDQAWSLFINDLTLGEEYKSLGLSCSGDELFDMVGGNNPHPQVIQAFTDPNTKKFDQSAVIKFLKDLPNRPEDVQRQWKSFEEGIRDERIAEKYKNIMKYCMYVTDVEAKRGYEENGRLANVRLVRLDINSVKDSAVKVEESDLQAYYSANLFRYKQPETIRKVEYVTFDVSPSNDDQQKTMSWIAERRAELDSTKDAATLVNLYAETTPYDSSYFAKGTLPAALDTVFFKSSIGTVVGPFIDGESVKVARLMGEKMIADSVKASHILLSIENGDTAKARATADSILKAVKGGADFASLATVYSKDPGSAMKGGDLGWFRQGMMVPQFNDACFNGSAGDYPIVTTQFGVHLIKITGKGNASRQIRVAIIDRKMEPSQGTYDAIYNKALAFVASATSASQFDTAVVKNGLNKRVAESLRESEKNIPGLDQPREMVRWAYNSEIGDVSQVFTMGDKYVVAKVVEVREKGTLPLDLVRDQVKVEATKKKKAEKLVEQFKAANGKTIEEMAAKLNTTVMEVDNIS
ncbi:MAG: peptidylprolyl isomerase, partial [Bacteroidota bacterium]